MFNSLQLKHARNGANFSDEKDFPSWSEEAIKMDLMLGKYGIRNQKL